MIRRMRYGGIDLGGTKIQAVVIVDEDHSVLGAGAPADAAPGRPAGRGEEMAQALRDAAKAAELELAALDGIGVGSPASRSTAGTLSSARNLPGWEGTFPLAAALESALGCEVAGSATTCRSRPTPSSSWAPGRPYDSLLGVFWGTGRRRRR